MGIYEISIKCFLKIQQVCLVYKGTSLIHKYPHVFFFILFNHICTDLHGYSHMPPLHFPIYLLHIYIQFDIYILKRKFDVIKFLLCERFKETLNQKDNYCNNILHFCKWLFSQFKFVTFILVESYLVWVYMYIF